MQTCYVLWHGATYQGTYTECCVWFCINVLEREQYAQQGIKDQNGIIKDSEFHIRSRGRSPSRFSNAEGKCGFKCSGKTGSRSGKGSLAVTDLLLGNSFCGTHHGNCMALKPQMVSWPSCVGTWVLGSGSPLLQEAGSQQVFPCPKQQVISWASYTGCAKPRPCLQELSKGGFHGVSQKHLSSVSTVLCSAQGEEDFLPLVFVAMKGLMFENSAPLAWYVSMEPVTSKCYYPFKRFALKYSSSGKVLMVLEAQLKTCAYFFFSSSSIPK